MKVLVDYDVFDTNTKGMTGVYLKTNEETNKHLIYFPSIEEYGELEDKQINRVSPGRVSKKNKEFVSRMITMKTTYGP